MSLCRPSVKVLVPLVWVPVPVVLSWNGLVVSLVVLPSLRLCPVCLSLIPVSVLSVLRPVRPCTLLYRPANLRWVLVPRLPVILASPTHCSTTRTVTLRPVLL